MSDVIEVDYGLALQLGVSQGTYKKESGDLYEMLATLRSELNAKTMQIAVLQEQLTHTLSLCERLQEELKRNT